MDVMQLRRNLLMMGVMGGDEMELIGQATINESLENDTYGNPKNIYNTYISPLLAEIDNYTACFVVAENNTASSYRLISCLFFKQAHTAAMGAILRINPPSTITTRDFGQSTSSWCSSGTTLKVYKIQDMN